jgi:hypothetical protein
MKYGKHESQFVFETLALVVACADGSKDTLVDNRYGSLLSISE